MSMSVVVCSRNRPELLGRLVRLLSRQSSVVEDTEIVVVDDASEPAYEHQFEDSRFPVKMVRNDCREGIAISRNTGMARAQGDVFLLTDDDVIPNDCWLSAHQDGWGYDQEFKPLFICGDYYCYESHPAEYPPNCLSVRFDSWTLWNLLQKYPNRRIPAEVAWMAFVTKNVSVSRKDIEMVGGFDHGYEGWGFEDTDLGVKLSVGFPDREAWCLPSCAYVLHPREAEDKLLTESAQKNFERLKGRFPSRIHDRFFTYLQGLGELPLD